MPLCNQRTARAHSGVANAKGGLAGGGDKERDTACSVATSSIEMAARARSMWKVNSSSREFVQGVTTIDLLRPS